MPRATLLKAIVDKQRDLGINRLGRIFVDDQWRNRQDYNAILSADLPRTRAISVCETPPIRRAPENFPTTLSVAAGNR
jgi:hypothetical protein